MKDLVACVVTHDGAETLPACLDAIAAQGDVVTRVVVVDDASSDGTVALLGARYPEVEVVGLAERGGPAAARNEGFALAGGARILFVDADIVLGAGCAARLAGALDDDPGALLAMPRVVRARAPGTIDFEGASSHALGQLVPERAGEPVGPPGPPRPCGSLVSSCFLLDRDRWGEAPPFDPAFAFNYEDHELGLRSRILGHRLLVAPEACCTHGTGTAGASVRDDAPYPPLRVRSLLAGRWRILLKLYQVRTLALLAPALILFEAVALLGSARRGWLGHWLAAAAATVRDLPRIVRARRRVQRARRVPDRALLVGGPLPFRAALPRGRLERAVLSALDALVGAWVTRVARFR